MKKRSYKMAIWIAVVVTAGSFVARFMSSASPLYFGDAHILFGAVTFCVSYTVGLAGIYLLNQIAGNNDEQGTS